MSGPLTDYQLGKIRHREMEAEVKPYWGKTAVWNRHQKCTFTLTAFSPWQQ